MILFTLQDVTTKLFQYFINNHIFSLEQNHSDIFEVSIEPELERAALLKSLEKFEDQKLVSRLAVGGKTVFLLNQPLQSFKQQIEISGANGAKLADLTNTWLKENGRAEYLVNPMEINEWGIQVLLQIAEAALAQGRTQVSS